MQAGPLVARAFDFRMLEPPNSCLPMQLWHLKKHEHGDSSHSRRELKLAKFSKNWLSRSPGDDNEPVELYLCITGTSQAVAIRNDGNARASQVGDVGMPKPPRVYDLISVFRICCQCCLLERSLSQLLGPFRQPNETSISALEAAYDKLIKRQYPCRRFDSGHGEQKSCSDRKAAS